MKKELQTNQDLLLSKYKHFLMNICSQNKDLI